MTTEPKDGYQTYLKEHADHNEKMLQKIISDAKVYGGNLDDAIKRIEWLVNFSREQKGEREVHNLLLQARDRLHEERENEIESVMKRPFRDHTVNAFDKPDWNRTLKRLFCGVICEAGGRLPIESDVLKMVGEMPDEEVDLLSFEFVEHHLGHKGHVQVNKRPKEKSDIPGIDPVGLKAYRHSQRFGPPRCPECDRPEPCPIDHPQPKGRG